LRASIASLELHVDSLENWLHFWVALVVLGVVLEVIFVIWEYREDLAEFRHGPATSRKPSPRKLVLELFGATLVALGVGGELGVDIKAGTARTDLRAKNGELVQLLQSVSAVALRNAAGAYERALKAESANLGLHKDLENAKSLLLTKQIELEKEQQNTLRVQARDHETQLAIVKSANPRSATFDQGRFLEYMKGVPPEVAEVWYEPTDPEAQDFAAIIHRALKAAGWEVGNAAQPRAGAGVAASTGLAVRARMRYDEPENGEGDIAIRETVWKGITGRQDIPDWPRPISAAPRRIFMIIVGHHQFRMPLPSPELQSPPKQ
jgi:hypothetical protein